MNNGKAVAVNFDNPVQVAKVLEQKAVAAQGLIRQLHGREFDTPDSALSQVLANQAALLDAVSCLLMAGASNFRAQAGLRSGVIPASAMGGLRVRER